MEKHYGYGGKTGDIHSKHTDAPHLNTKMIQKGTQHPPSDTNRLTKKNLIRLGNQENQTKWKNTMDTAGKTGDIHSKHTDAPHLNTKMIQKGTQHPPSDTNRLTKKNLIRLGNQENQTKWKNTMDTAGKQATFTQNTQIRHI